MNASARGTITDKTYEDVKLLFNKIARNNSIAPVERGAQAARRQGAILELDATNGLAAQVALLTTQFNTFMKTQQNQPVVTCGLCQESHHIDQCPQLAEVNMIRNFQRNQGWQNQQQQGAQQHWQSQPNHGNSSWQNQQPKQYAWGQQNNVQGWQNQQQNQQGYKSGKTTSFDNTWQQPEFHNSGRTRF